MSYMTMREARLHQCQRLLSAHAEKPLCTGVYCMDWRWHRDVRTDDIDSRPGAEKSLGYCGLSGEPTSDAVFSGM